MENIDPSTYNECISYGISVKKFYYIFCCYFVKEFLIKPIRSNININRHASVT